MRSEPTITVGVLTTLVSTIIGLLVAFGLDVSDAQRNAVLATIGAAYPVVILMLAVIRSKVYAPDTVQQIKAKEYNAGHKAGVNAASGVK